MNFGHKIAIVFIGFVLLIISLVTLCIRQTDIHLVTERYYEKEIAYQDQIDIEQSTAALQELPKFKYGKDSQILTVQYPDKFKAGTTTGKILFFRPSDATKDFTIPVKTENNQEQKISVADLEKGFWKIKMEWTFNDNRYYLEEKLVVL